jgi:hypothetical protein
MDKSTESFSARVLRHRQIPATSCLWPVRRDPARLPEPPERSHRPTPTTCPASSVPSPDLIPSQNRIRTAFGTGGRPIFIVATSIIRRCNDHLKPPGLRFRYHVRWFGQHSLAAGVRLASPRVGGTRSAITTAKPGPAVGGVQGRSRRMSQRGLPPLCPAVWQTRLNPCASKSGTVPT